MSSWFFSTFIVNNYWYKHPLSGFVNGLGKSLILSAECTYNSVGNNIYMEENDKYLSRIDVKQCKKLLSSSCRWLGLQAFRLAVVSEICPIPAFPTIYHLVTATLSWHLSCRTYFSKIKIVCSLTSIWMDDFESGLFGTISGQCSLSLRQGSCR